jgi:hypothetical protein
MHIVLVIQKQARQIDNVHLENYTLWLRYFQYPINDL